MNRFSTFKKENLENEFYAAVKHCKLCKRLSSRRKILSKQNGNVDSRIMFIAEAPGRLGADRTGVPLYGDRTGSNFEGLLKNVGWKRQDIFITNAILCNPREENGNNDNPTSEEIQNCSRFLLMTIQLVNPDVIVTLGQRALEAIHCISPHNYSLKNYVGKNLPWYGRVLIPLYHPGPRACLHRSLIKQRFDFMRLAKFVNPKQGIKVKRNLKRSKQQNLFDEFTPTPLQRLVVDIIQMLSTVSYFKLVKLLYLIDLEILKRKGNTLTQQIYLRQDEGPWTPSLAKALKSLQGREILMLQRRRKPILKKGPSPRYGGSFNFEILNIISEVVAKYGNLSNAEIKTIVYLTEPMKYILKEEKKGRDMRKVPVLYKNQISLQLDNH